MDNFNKFLAKGEILQKTFDSKRNSLRVYGIILLFMPLFFVLFPMWKIGYQGVALWFVALISLIFLLAKTVTSQNYKYLLTNNRLIHLKVANKKDYKLVGFIKLDFIDRVLKQGNGICILSNGRKYYLLSLESPDNLCQSLNSYIKKQNLV